MLPSIHSVGEARLGFHPTASSYFYVIEYIEEGPHGDCIAVDIYSSETAAWICKESEWGEGTKVAPVISASVFLNSCLHIIGFSGGYDQILAMDMQGNTWRKIHRPIGGVADTIHQAQSHLCVY